MSAEDFVSAIRQFTDRREGTRQRILQAARKLDNDDVVLTPALVADAVHELYESWGAFEKGHRRSIICPAMFPCQRHKDDGREQLALPFIP